MSHCAQFSTPTISVITSARKAERSGGLCKCCGRGDHKLFWCSFVMISVCISTYTWM
jgi:hypothetical protein